MSSLGLHGPQVDKRTIERFEREAKQLNRESWFLAFIMDTNEVPLYSVCFQKE